jgi:tRNA G10  N-methylase Trm11
MQLRTIHPFPARMAPELALNALHSLPPNSVVLDPMAGSGTVLRQAVELGHRAIGFDLDPLAVLMSKVWTTPIDDQVVGRIASSAIEEARTVDLRSSKLPWVQTDKETANFIDYWFAAPQRRDLQRLSFVLHQRAQTKLAPKERAALDVMRIALSRIIVTKEQVASLARDTSHSRPHKVAETSSVNVFDAYSRSLEQLRKRLKDEPPVRGATVSHGDARKLSLADSSVDAVITSPPYLNAIDYLRGHRMSLVWLGHRLPDLRQIRATSIGAERAGDPLAGKDAMLATKKVAAAMLRSGQLPANYASMVQRYAYDLICMASEIRRVLKPGAQATFVVGNSCLKGAFIKNSRGVATASVLAGLRKVSEFERELPASNRYLPMPSDGALGKRMRTEAVLTFSN